MPKFQRSLSFFVLFVCLFVLAVTAASAQRTFHATLDGAQEVPPNASPATGTGTVTLNAAETQITVSLNFTGLTGAQTDAHIHGPAARGASASPMIGLPTGTITNQIFAISPTQVTALKAGLTYFNIHTTTFGGGEIRGQIEPVCEPVPVGLVSWWSGDGNALDSLSRNSGTLQGNVTFPSGNVGPGFRLGRCRTSGLRVRAAYMITCGTG